MQEKATKCIALPVSLLQFDFVSKEQGSLCLWCGSPACQESVLEHIQTDSFTESYVINSLSLP